MKIDFQYMILLQNQNVIQPIIYNYMRLHIWARGWLKNSDWLPISQCMYDFFRQMILGLNRFKISGTLV